MRNLIVIKNFIDPEILQKINDDLMRCLENFLTEEKKLGGQRYGHLNATIGHHADTILGQVNEKGLLKKIEKEYDLNIEDYFLTCACNINLPGSKKQHVHRDTNFDDSKIIINIPLVDVNEDNGSIEVYPGSNGEPLSFLDFLLSKNKYPPKRINTILGDIFIRDSNLFHRGMDNLTNTPRSMVAITLSKKELATPSEIAAPFGGGKVDFMNNWFEDDLFGKITETIYMYLPVIRSIKRILASLIKDKNLST